MTVKIWETVLFLGWLSLVFFTFVSLHFGLVGFQDACDRCFLVSILRVFWSASEFLQILDNSILLLQVSWKSSPSCSKCLLLVAALQIWSWRREQFVQPPLVCLFVSFGSSSFFPSANKGAQHEWRILMFSLRFLVAFDFAAALHCLCLTIYFVSPKADGLYLKSLRSV